jgi:Tfp pilus assembly protein PilN
VALLAMQPNLQNRQVRISGEAKNLEAVFDYARRLGTSALLDQVYLTEHAVKTEQAQKPVAFSLVAQWTDLL